MHGLSEERLAPVNGIEIAYQEIGDPDGEPLLLIMGLATQMLAWDEEFCAMLAERGFRVVRFDNRDIGRSTKIESAGLPKRTDMLLGPPPHRALPAARHGRGHDRADGPPGDRVGAPGRRLDGRDDRPDDGDPPPASGCARWSR